MTNEKFKRDLKQGQIYEKKALDYFEYESYNMKEGYFKEYDIELFDKEGKKILVEVKSDRLSCKTGNLCIEHKYKNNPSGIEATLADYWVYFVLYCKDGNTYGEVIKEECYVIPTNELKELVKNCRSVYGGDGRFSQMYLLKKSNCQKYIKNKINK